MPSGDDVPFSDAQVREISRACNTASSESGLHYSVYIGAAEGDIRDHAEQAAVIGGFQQQEHRELIAPFVERYFEVVAEAWEQRTSEMAQQIAIGLYPALCVSQETIDRTDTYLRTAQPVPSLRRLITENRDNVARALRAQQRDQQS